MPSSNDDIVTLCNGEISVWIDSNSSIHLKCVTRHGDPVEMNAEEAEELCRAIQKMVERLE